MVLKMVIKIERWKDGKLRYVERDSKGRFKSWSYVPKEKYEVPRFEKPFKRAYVNLKYDVRFKVAYLSDKRPNKNRVGAIAGIIISPFELDDAKLIDLLLEEVKDRFETWLNYVEPNKIWDVHVYASITDIEVLDVTVYNVKWEDLGGWGA